MFYKVDYLAVDKYDTLVSRVLDDGNKIIIPWGDFEICPNLASVCIFIRESHGNRSLQVEKIRDVMYIQTCYYMYYLHVLQSNVASINILIYYTLFSDDPPPKKGPTRVSMTCIDRLVRYLICIVSHLPKIK